MCDITVGHRENRGTRAMLLSSNKGEREYYCQRCILPAELQPHNLRSKLFILVSFKFITISIKLPRLFFATSYLMSHEKT